MFKALTSFVQSENAKWVFVAIVVCIMLYSVMSYSNGKVAVKDGMYSDGNVMSTVTPPVNKLNPSKFGDASASVESTSGASDYQAAPTNNPDELLPRDDNSKWGELNPVNSSNGQQMPDLLNAVSRIGLDTIGQTMKNANLQLRSDPTIAKQNVGPWNNSTYEPDLARVPLELGCGAP